MGFDSDDAIMIAEAKESLAQGRRKAAYETLQALLARSPQNAEAWYQLNFTLADPDKRIRALQRSLKANPDHSDALQLYMQLAEPSDGQDFAPVTPQTAEPLPQPSLEEITPAARRTAIPSPAIATELHPASTMEVEALRVVLEAPPAEGSFTRRTMAQASATFATVRGGTVSFVSGMFGFLKAQFRHPIKFVLLLIWLGFLIGYTRLTFWVTIFTLALLYERQRPDVWQTLREQSERLATGIPARWRTFRAEFATLETEEKIGVVVGFLVAVLAFWLAVSLLQKLFIGW